jgi:hypothetical protein
LLFPFIIIILVFRKLFKVVFFSRSWLGVRSVGSVGDRPGKGEVVCAQCGLVVAEAAVDTGPEWRVFDREKRARTAPLKLVVKTNMAVRLEHGVQWFRLARFHREITAGRGGWLKSEAS